jgi:hypothetical protein
MNYFMDLIAELQEHEDNIVFGPNGHMVKNWTDPQNGHVRGKCIKCDQLIACCENEECPMSIVAEVHDR